MTRRAPAAVLLVAALALPGAAAGADEVVGVLAVADPPGPTPELAAANEQLRAALSAVLPGVLDAATLRTRMTGPPPPATLAELKRAHAGAVAAYTAGEFESSVKTLRDVADALEALPESAEVFAQWAETMLRLARTEQELGRRVEAQADLERLLRAAPDAKPDGRQYPPSFLALVGDSRERLRAVGTRRLAVEADPGVRVFVDGREVGAGPVTVSLPPGRYRVAGERDGARIRAVVADLSQDDRSVVLDLRSAAVMRPEMGPGLAVAATERPLPIVAAAARIALDRAVATSLVRDGDATLLVATAYEVRRGKAEREGRIRMESGVPPPGAIEALAAFVATGRASALVSTPAGPSLAMHVPPPTTVVPSAAPVVAPPAPGGPPAPGAPMQPGASSRGSGYLAAAIVTGAVAALGAYGTYDNARRAEASDALARAMKDGSGNLRPQFTQADYDARIRYGDEDRTKAYVFAGGTAVALAATTIFAIIAYRHSGEPGAVRF